MKYPISCPTKNGEVQSGGSSVYVFFQMYPEHRVHCHSSAHEKINQTAS